MSNYECSPSIVIRTKANNSIGFGHIVRCNIIAHELIKRKWRVFIAMWDGSVWRGDYDSAGISKLIIPPVVANNSREEIEWIYGQTGNVEWMLIDDYELAEEYERFAYFMAKNVAVIDGTCRKHYCDLWIDPIARPQHLRSELNLKGGCTLEGEGYIPIDPAYSELGHISTALVDKGSVSTLLVHFGGGDGVHEHVEIILNALAKAGYVGEVILVGADDAVCDAHRSYPFTVTIIEWTNELASVMAKSDAAIGASGMASWERCAIGLPALAFKIAENQEYVNDRMGGFGAALAVNKSPSDCAESDLVALINTLLTDTKKRNEIRELGRALCDGNGAKRIADKLCELA